MGRRHLFCLLMLPLLSARVDAYSSGATVTACSSLTPIHHDSEPQKRVSPFSLHVDTRYFMPGEHVKVCVYGPPWVGIMLQARSHSMADAVGRFLRPKRPGLKTTSCFNHNDTITHKNTVIKNNNTCVTWVAPMNIKASRVFFSATVVKSLLFYWAKLQSATVELTLGIAEDEEGEDAYTHVHVGNVTEKYADRHNGSSIDDDDYDDDVNYGYYELEYRWENSTALYGALVDGSSASLNVCRYSTLGTVISSLAMIKLSCVV